MKRFLALLLLALAAGTVHAQTYSTVVTVNTTDSSNTPWFNGTYTVNFVGPAVVSWPGGTVQRSYSGTLNASGTFQITLPDNLTITPTPTFWTFTVCPFPNISRSTDFCLVNQQFSISGPAKTINFNPPQPQIPATTPFPVSALEDSNITGPVALGFSYYQEVTAITGNLRACAVIAGNAPFNCTTWVNVGGSSGGGSPGVFPRWDQLLNPIANSSPNFTGSVFTFTNGTWNFNTMALLLPGAPLFTAGTAAQIGYDTSNHNLHSNNGVDSIVGLFPASTTFVNGDLAGIVVSGGQISLTDVPVNGSAPDNDTSFLQITVTNPVVNQTACITSVSGTAYTFENCTPGVPVDLETTNYNVDMVNDRGSAVVMHSSTSPTITVPTAFGAGGSGDASWFDFNMNTGVSPVSINLTAPSVWDSTGTQTEVLQPGQQMSLLTDTSTGIAYPKAHEPRLAPGLGISFDRSNPYLVTISSTPASTFTGNQVVSGCGVSWTSGLTFEVQACTYQIAGVTYTSAETSQTLSAADPSNPRFDVIYVNASSAVGHVTGTAASNPQIPTVDPTTQLPLTSILVPTSATQPNVNTAIIYQNNAGAPTEWNCTSSANINCASTNNPFGSFTHSVEATTAVTTNNSTFTIGTGSVNLANYSMLVFYIRNKAAWASAKSIQIFFKSGSANVGTAVTFKNGAYGFAQSNTTTYQEIVIPVTAFGTNTATVTALEMEVLGGGAGIGYYLGNIQLQGGFNGGGGAGGGSGGLQLQVDGVPCQTPCNLQDSATVTFSQSVSGGVTNIQAAATSSGGITSINSATGPAITVQGAGGASVATSTGTNTITVTSAAASSGDFIQNITSSTYAVTNADNHFQDVFSRGGDVAVSLPQAGSISVNPQVGNKSNSNIVSATPTTGTFSQTAGNTLTVAIAFQDATITVSSVTDTAGDIFQRAAPDVREGGSGNHNFASLWYATNILTSASNSVTVHMSNSTTTAVRVDEWTTVLAFDTGTSGFSNTNTGPSLSVPAAYSNEINFFTYGGAPANCPTGLGLNQANLGSGGLSQQYVCWRYLSNTPSITIPAYGPVGGVGFTADLADFGISGVASFQSGWWFIATNATSSNQGVVTITPTTSLINGKSSLTLFPGESCRIQSDGTNYNAACSGVPTSSTVNQTLTGTEITSFFQTQSPGTSSIGATNMLNGDTPSGGGYMMAGYGEVTTAGTSCAGNTTVVLNAIFTSPAAAGTTTQALGTWTITTNGTVGTTNFGWPPFYFLAKSGTSIQFSTTYTAGGSCSPAPAVRITPVLKVY